MLLILGLLFSFSAFSQVVTSSFDRGLITTNPAAATLRNFGQFSFTHNSDKTDSDITLPNGSNSDDVKWKEEIQIHRQELIIAGSKGKIVPEFYLSQNTGSKKQSVEGGQSDSDNKISFLNNMLNIGYRYKPWLDLGIKLARPMVSFSSVYDQRNPDSSRYTGTGKQKSTITTIGSGITFKPFKNVYLGAFYSHSTEASKGSFTENVAGQSQTYDNDNKSNISRMGLGLSLLSGHSLGKGWRFEVSYSQMNSPETQSGPAGEKREKGKEIKTSLEFAHKGFVFGGNVRLIKSIYYDQEDLLRRFFVEDPYKQTFEPSFGGFASLSSAKGHSFGLSGYYYTSKGKRQFQGNPDAEAASKVMNLSLSYAYLF